MGKITRTRRTLIAADMARMLRELEQTSTQESSAKRAPAAPRAAGSAVVIRGK
ncbi:MAG TPA: hypothetical protein VF278_20270 [Pirellulales bacterium]